MKKTLLITMAIIGVIIVSWKKEKHHEITPQAKTLEQQQSFTFRAPKVEETKKPQAKKETIVPTFEMPKNLQGKAVLSKEDRIQLLDYYSNVRTIMNAYMELNRLDNIAIDKTYESRLRAMHYLITGATMRDNPEKENIAQYLFHYVLKDHFEQLSDMNKRKLVFADKVEILSLFKKNYPELYTQLKQNYEGPHLNKLMAFVERK